MNSELQLDKRISVLEKSMEWAQSSIQNIDKNLDIIKSTQYQMIDKFSEFKIDMDQKFHEVNEKFTSLQAENKLELASLRTETIERISSLQKHNDEKLTQAADRISSLQAHADEKFLAVHARFSEVHGEFAEVHKEFTGVNKEFAGVHKEIAGIHHAISVQTKWLLGMMIASATMISFLHPLAMSLLAK